MIELVGLICKVDWPIKNFSDVERQRLGIAQSVIFIAVAIRRFNRQEF